MLDGVAGRARLSHLRKYIADPQGVKPGTTMPALFDGDPEKDTKIEALVHFLAGTGTPRAVRPDLKAVIRGRDTFGKVGCTACHGGRDVSGEPARPQFGFAVPLGDLKGKYTIPGLTAFLASPLQVRPAGRMPHLLKPNEAADVAHFLLQGAKVNLRAVMYRGDNQVLLDAKELEKVKVEAVVAEHLRGTKVRVFKYKPKKGYRRRSGHRQELTRLEVTNVRLLTRKPAAKTEAKPAEEKAEAPAKAKPAGRKPAAKKPATRKPAAKKPAAKKPAAGGKSQTTRKSSSTAGRSSSAKS